MNAKAGIRRVLMAGLAAFVFPCLPSQALAGSHLFILSGQSNMARLDPETSFTPEVKKTLGEDRVIVVKFASGGKPIQRWHKDWEIRGNEDPGLSGDLYDRLMGAVDAAIKGKEIETVTFVWMQGETDAVDKGDRYETSLIPGGQARSPRLRLNCLPGCPGFPPWGI